jgi:hypothetical protein
MIFDDWRTFSSTTCSRSRAAFSPMRRSSFTSRLRPRRAAGLRCAGPMGIGHTRPGEAHGQRHCPATSRRSTARPSRQSPASASTAAPTTAPSTPPACRRARPPAGTGGSIPGRSWPPAAAPAQPRTPARRMAAVSTASAPAQAARQRGQPGAQRPPAHPQPPGRMAEQEQCQIGHPGTQQPTLVAPRAPVPEVVNAGSWRWWLARASSIKSHSTPPSSSAAAVCGSRQRGTRCSRPMVRG